MYGVPGKATGLIIELVYKAAYIDVPTSLYLDSNQGRIA